MVQGTLQPCEGDVGIGHQAGVVQRLGAGVEEGGELGVVAEAATRQQGGDRSTEAREDGRIEERLGQMPLQARTDHAANGSRARPYRSLTNALSAGRGSARQRLSGLTARPVPAGRALRFASHSYQETSSWLALKIDE